MHQSYRASRSLSKLIGEFGNSLSHEERIYKVSYSVSIVRSFAGPTKQINIAAVLFNDKRVNGTN